MASNDETRTTEKSEKVTVSLKPAGNAPLLRQRKFLVERNRTVGWMLQWLKKTLKCESDESVFVYVQQSFAPSPDQNLDTLYENQWRTRGQGLSTSYVYYKSSPKPTDLLPLQCYGVGDKLIMHYCKTQAWG